MQEVLAVQVEYLYAAVDLFIFKPADGELNTPTKRR